MTEQWHDSTIHGWNLDSLERLVLKHFLSLSLNEKGSSHMWLRIVFQCGKARASDPKSTGPAGSPSPSRGLIGTISLRSMTRQAPV